MATWRNVAGSYTIEVGFDDQSNLIDLGSGQDLEFLRQYLEHPDSSEVTINFRSSGSYEPASMYGGWDQLGWPEELVDDRELDYAQVFVNGQAANKLHESIGRKLFDMYESEINDVELESNVESNVESE